MTLLVQDFAPHRFDFSGDASVYSQDFDLIQSGYTFFEVRNEIGLLILMKLVGLFAAEYSDFLIFYYIIASSIIVLTINPEQRNPALEIMLCAGVLAIIIWTPIVLVQLRQCIALLILALLCRYPFKKSYRYLLCTIAVMSHYSFVIALLGMLAIWVTQNVKFKNWLITHIIILCCYILEIPNLAFDYIIQLIQVLIGFKLNGLGMLSDVVVYDVGFSVKKFAPYALALLFAISFRRQIEKNQQLCDLYKLIVVLSSVGILFSAFPYHDRIMNYSWVLVPLLVAGLANRFRGVF